MKTNRYTVAELRAQLRFAELLSRVSGSRAYVETEKYTDNVHYIAVDTVGTFDGKEAIEFLNELQKQTKGLTSGKSVGVSSYDGGWDGALVTIPLKSREKKDILLAIGKAKKFFPKLKVTLTEQVELG